MMNRLMRRLLVTAGLLLGSVPVSAGEILDGIKSRGMLHCGVSEGIPGFSSQRDGRWQGLDVDYCRALAAAALGDANAVRFTPLDARNRFNALGEGRVDVLARNSTWTLAREARFGIRFVGVLFFDGQGFLARRPDGPRYALELGGTRVCVKPQTTSERNLANYFTRHEMAYQAVPVADFASMRQAFETGACDAVTSDQSQLHALRVSLADPDSARVLPEFISKEPLSPAVPAADAQWTTLARLVLSVLINAEELGITAANVDGIARIAKSTEVRGLLDLDDRFANSLGLAPGWAPRMVKSVGNYAAIFQRNLGKGSALGLARGQNALWNRGGLIYAPRID